MNMMVVAVLELALLFATKELVSNDDDITEE